MTILFNEPVALTVPFSVHRSLPWCNPFVFFPSGYELARHPQSGSPCHVKVYQGFEGREGYRIEFDCEPVLPSAADLRRAKAELQRRFGVDDLWLYSADARDVSAMPWPQLRALTPLGCDPSCYIPRNAFVAVRCILDVSKSQLKNLSTALASQLGWAGELVFCLCVGWAKFRCRVTSTVTRERVREYFNPGNWELFTSGKPANLFFKIDDLLQQGVLRIEIAGGVSVNREECVSACAQALLDGAHTFSHEFYSVHSGPPRLTDTLHGWRYKGENPFPSDDHPIDLDHIHYENRTIKLNLNVRANGVPPEYLVPSL